MNDTPVNTKAEPSAFDIMAEEKAEPDEPKFTLWAHDPAAPACVNHWVRLRRDLIVRAEDLPPEKRRLELIQCAEAEDIAFAMTAWQKGQAQAAPVEQPSNYSGSTMSEEELAAKARHDTLVEGSRTLDDTLARSLDVARAIRDMGFFDESIAIEVAANSLREVSAKIKPQRPSYAHLA